MNEDITRLIKSAEKPEKKSTKPPYKKPQAVKDLEQMEYDIRYKNSVMPESARFKDKYRDDTANGLTKCVILYIKLIGGFATRINTTGMYRADIKKFIPNTQRKGLADVSAVIKGRAVSIEIKVGKDRMSEAQLKIKSEVERAGGVYIIARNFEQFKNEIDTINTF